MALRRQAKTEAREPLTRERVLDAAIALADADGIDALSMRRLGQEVGVEAMSLYHHVGKKDALISAIVDLVVQEFEQPSSELHWKEALRRAAVSAHETLLRHPWAASLILSGTDTSFARLRHMDAILGTLRRAGFSAAMTDHAYHALESHIMGFTLWIVGMNLPSGDDFKAMAASFLEQLPHDELPYLVEHVGEHLKPRDDINEFEFGLNLILDGLERSLALD